MKIRVRAFTLFNERLQFAGSPIYAHRMERNADRTGCFRFYDKYGQLILDVHPQDNFTLIEDRIVEIDPGRDAPPSSVWLD